MANVGERASLVVLRETRVGLFLDAGGQLGEVLLPVREMPSSWEIGGRIEVFIYCDSEDRPVATTKRPKVMPGGFGYLEVVASTGVGAFLDWGLPKDLLLPFGEQKSRMEVGRSYVVRVDVDEASGRIIASQRLGRYLSEEKPRLVVGDEVELILYGKTDLGYKAIVNEQYSGLLFANEVFRRLHAGERTKGYVVQVRADGKIDLSLYPPGRARVEELEARIIQELHKRGGSWDLCDASPPERINAALGVSKKVFKRATGALFRKRMIAIEEDGIRLLEDEDWSPE
jgi:predicted RNA-binding protein (virulence factor B family)